MVDISGFGTFAGGFAEGSKKGIALTQQQRNLDLQALRLAAGSQDMVNEQLAFKNLQDLTSKELKTTQSKGQAAGLIKQLRSIANLDKNIRAPQVDALIEQFKTQTGKPPAENLIKTLKKGDSQQINAIIDSVEQNIQSDPNFDMSQLAASMTDPAAVVQAVSSANLTAPLNPEQQRQQRIQNLQEKMNTFLEFAASHPGTKAAEAATKQAKTFQTRIDSLQKGSKIGFDRASKLRGEFTKVTKEFSAQNDAFSRILSSSEAPSAAGDVALIFNFMKLLDPGSTVREGEFATVEQTGGVPDRIRTQYNKLLSGKRLSERQRKDFVARAFKLFEGASKNFDKRSDVFAGLAERQGIDPGNVVIERNVFKDRLPELRQRFLGEGSKKTEQQKTNLPSGTVIRNKKTGQLFRSNGKFLVPQ